MRENSCVLFTSRESKFRWSVVVGSGRSNLGIQAVVWDATHGMRTVKEVLGLSGVVLEDGWELRSTRGVSADGTVIVGYGINPEGNTEAWRAVIPEIPEPGSITLLACGALGLLAYGWRRGRR